MPVRIHNKNEYFAGKPFMAAQSLPFVGAFYFMKIIGCEKLNPCSRLLIIKVLG
jgi:hypothetical protein